MTAVSSLRPGTALDDENHDPTALRWSEQGFVFEIRSTDNLVLESARRVFAVRSPAEGDVTTRSWTVERVDVNGDDCWVVSGESAGSLDLPVREKDRDNAILAIEQDALEWLANNSGNSIAVHAALLSRNGRGVVIVGPSFAGKSTLATALWRNGWSLMSDDMVFIDTASGVASPAPRRVSLRFESRELVGDTTWNQIRNTPSCLQTWKGLYFHPHEISGLDKVRTTSLAAIFFLARRDTVTDPASVSAMNPAKGSLALLPYAFNARTLPFMEGLRRITPLLDQVPAFDLGRGDLRSMIDAVEATVG